MSGVGGLYFELRRRNVLRVAWAYAVIGWLLLQVASILLPTFAAPAWIMQGVTILLAVGFPIALILAWVYDISSTGIVRDEGAGQAAADMKSVGRTFDFVVIGLLVIALSLFAYDEFVIEEIAMDQSSRRPAIAVLPFAVDVDLPDDRMLADALATELIMQLSDWPSFPVIARAASFNPDLSGDMFVAGETLDARYFVTGDMRSSNNQIRVNVSVTDTTNGRIVWSDSFNREQGDILDMEKEMSRAIVSQINPQLLATESERAVRKNPANLNAWEAAHRGWWHIGTETEAGYEEANLWFDRAIDLEPSWGWPYAAKALMIYRSYLNGWTRRTDESKQEMLEYANKAINADANDAFAHHALGHAYGVVNRRDDSINALARGVELNPNDAMASACYGMQLAAANRPQQAKEAVEHAISLSPQDPWMHWFTLVLARASFAAGDYEASERWAIRSIQLKPNFASFLHSVSAAAQAGKLDVARQRVIDMRATGPLPPVDALERNFNTHTEAEYTTRLMEGLRLADFDTAGKE
jgi:TolB-like protein/tetratricopeptide (TPR) repeat protein